MFRVGQKLACVRPTEVCKCLVKDRVYTCIGFQANGWVIIDCCSNHPGGGWYPDRFRPIVERKTDISIFTKMLSPVRKHEVAR